MGAYWCFIVRHHVWIVSSQVKYLGGGGALAPIVPQCYSYTYAIVDINLLSPHSMDLSH